MMDLVIHVIISIIGLMFGLYAGIITRGFLKYFSISRTDKKARKLEEKYERKQKKKEEKEKRREEKFKNREQKKEAKRNKREDKEEFKETKMEKKRSLKSCLYDKSQSWTDFNCSLDGEDSNQVISKNRKRQDNSYNIIKRQV